MQFSKEKRRRKIQYRIRRKVKGTAQRPRLNVYRSNKEIYCQLIDDVKGNTLVSASSRDKDIGEEGTKIERSAKVGKLLSERAKAENIDQAVFDRGGYLYHGRVKSLAEGAREAGLKF
jgi:large subunit ribosomal protein L18